MKKTTQPQYVNPKKTPNVVKNTVKNQQKTLGGNIQKFNDIPDNVSNFSKVTKTKSKMGPQAKLRKQKLEKAEKELTAKPNNIVFDKKHDDGFSESNFDNGKIEKIKKEVTDKPNNIRAPINYNQLQN